MTRPGLQAVMGRLNARVSILLLAVDIDLFFGMTDKMPDFKTFLDSPCENEIDKDRFPEPYRNAAVQSSIAEGITDEVRYRSRVDQPGASLAPSVTTSPRLRARALDVGRRQRSYVTYFATWPKPRLCLYKLRRFA